MPKIQDSRVHKSSGIAYRYDAEYAEASGEANWSATVFVSGMRPWRLNGTARFDSEVTPAFSAVATCVRAQVEAKALAED